jgi:hypothetical protein
LCLLEVVEFRFFVKCVFHFIRRAAGSLPSLVDSDESKNEQALSFEGVESQIRLAFPPTIHAERSLSIFRLRSASLSYR